MRNNGVGDDRVAHNTGDTMSFRLRDEDARAVDMLLNRAQATGGDGNGGGAMTSVLNAGGGFQQRLTAVEQLLQVLDQMPAAEPSVDLASKAMQRLEEAIVAGAVSARRPAAAPQPGTGAAARSSL